MDSLRRQVLRSAVDESALPINHKPREPWMNLHSSERLLPGGWKGASLSVGARFSVALHEPIARLFRSRGMPPIHATDEPIRAELFSTERLELHAESLAAAQQINSKPT